MDTEGQMGNGMEESGQSDLSSTVETGLSSRTLKGSKGHQPGLQQEVKGKDTPGSSIFHWFVLQSLLCS